MASHTSSMVMILVTEAGSSASWAFSAQSTVPVEASISRVAVAVEAGTGSAVSPAMGSYVTSRDSAAPCPPARAEDSGALDAACCSPAWEEVSDPAAPSWLSPCAADAVPPEAAA